VITFSLKTVFHSIILGFLFCKGLLLQLLSWKSPGKLFLKKSTNPGGGGGNFARENGGRDGKTRMPLSEIPPQN